MAGGLQVMKTIKIIFLLLLLFASPVCATDWYVDIDNDGGTENGTTWATAWGKLTDIVWGSISAGDTIWISDGEYNQRLSIGASGSDGSPISIKPGGAHPTLSSGHTGTVYIDGTGGGSYEGLSVSSKDYVTINGQVGASSDCYIVVRDWYFSGVSIGGSSDHVTIQYLEVTGNNIVEGACSGVFWHVTGHDAMGELAYCKVHDQNYGDELWIVYEGSVGAYTNYDSLKIHHNDIFNFHADAVKLATNNTSFYNNKIHDRGVYIADHPDGIQSYGSYVKIYNNEFYNFIRSPADGLGNSYIRHNPDADGGHPWSDPHHYYVYNNLFYETRTPDGSSVFRGLEISFTDTSIKTVNNIYIYNNTIAGVPYAGLGIYFLNGEISGDVSDIYIENNIIVDCARNMSTAMQLTPGSNLTYGDHGESVDVVVDYNSIYASSGIYHTGILYNGSLYSYADFLALNKGQANGLHSGSTMIDPDLNASYQPADSQAGVVGEGVALNGAFTTDKNSISRGTAWDIGAYEFAEGNFALAPVAPKNLRID